jgi:hypothetical protein
LLLQGNRPLFDRLLKDFVPLPEFPRELPDGERNHANNQKQDDDQVAGAGEDEAERLRIDLGNLQEDDRSDGAKKCKRQLYGSEQYPVPREWAVCINATRCKRDRSEQIPYDQDRQHQDQQSRFLLERSEKGVDRKADKDKELLDL